MKIIVNTLKGARFEIQVKPEDSVAVLKKKIETVMGASAYHAEQQMLIHKGKVLKDGTTMETNNVAEGSVIAITKGIPEQTQEPAARGARDSKGFYYLPEGLPKNGTLDFLRHTEQSNRSLVKGEPLEGGGAGGNHMAQPQELQDDHAELLGFESNEPNEGGGDGGNQMEEYVEMKAQVTVEEYESIERLEAMGFERGDVGFVFFACNKNEDLAATFLLDHIHELHH